LSFSLFLVSLAKFRVGRAIRKGPSVVGFMVVVVVEVLLRLLTVVVVLGFPGFLVVLDGFRWLVFSSLGVNFLGGWGCLGGGRTATRLCWPKLQKFGLKKLKPLAKVGRGAGDWMGMWKAG